MKRRLALMASEYLEEILDPDLPVLEWVDSLESRILGRQVEGAGEFRSRASRMIVEMELQASREGALFPFTRILLRRLEHSGIHTAIITRNCEAAVRMVFPDLEDFCGCFLARDHVERVKPDPGHLRRALVHFGSAAGSSLMVGDHPLDVQTGKRAGTLTAGVASGSGSWDDLARSGADWVASDCESLFLELKRMGLV
ncbi:MAG: HAD hydrolase-like protein [Syntrophobacteraceae bacterium]|jgi:phosphoglycolate phosphatase|nr:HAD hydrolase-like protein [Syntrophobacteraceae bacterium]